jgi:hypothetical protein
MKPRTIPALLAALAVAVVLVAPVRAQEAMDQEAMMKLWEKYSTPSAHHKDFEKYVGKWNASMKMWMDPSAPPVESPGSAEYTLLLGGRWLMQNFKGTMMGMPFEGLGLSGYDNFREEYVSTWMDNVSTAGIKITGKRNAETGELTMTGPMDEPMTGERDKTFKAVEKWLGPDSFVFAAYDNIPGKGEVKVMEITYTRMK